MTKLIKKESDTINLYFNVDEQSIDNLVFSVISDFDNSKVDISLPMPLVQNERYVLFNLDNPFKDFNEGLYTYSLVSNYTLLDKGSFKMEGDDFGTNDLIEFDEFDEDGDDFIVVED
ncbi:hypothetical protein GEO21_21655 [Sphingobacterium faecium]|uniref:hypothetical protein n=1 Tax=Sphingobacterium faecium TaxID=34087 RepID=UPI0012920ACA|nr:hypothetical protein [Sphingobacterium faecium]MQP30092.1 hypothetical protein [Sphingobacterium faecium]